MKHRVIQLNQDQSLAIAEQPLRDLLDDEILIETHAFGINRPDLLQRSGLYLAPADASPILGLEIAGIVTHCGRAVHQWHVGDRVCALVNGGGYSDYCIAPASQCLPWPEAYSAEEAACLPEALFTVWHNLFQRGRLRSGDSVLIQGGSGGIGTTAIQLAKLFGARVFTTAGSTEKCSRCIELGADIAINYHAQDFVEPLLNATQQGGIDIVLDTIGGDAVNKHISLCANDGRIVNIAVLSGSRAEINVAALMLKRLTLTGSTLRAQSSQQKSDIAADILAKAWPWIESTRFRPVIDSVFSFTDVDSAHQHMQNQKHFGKIAITINR